MAFESNSTPVVTDGAKGVAAQDHNQEGLLHKLQLAAGLQDNYFANKVVDAADKAKHYFEDPIELKHWIKEEKPPSDKERADAEKALENRTSKLIPEADRQVMKEMTTALTNGDAHAFAEACKKAGGNPEKLKKLVEEVDRMLEEKHCSTRLDVTGDGKVLVHDSTSGTALAFDPRTGGVEGKAVEHNLDGSVLVKPGELLHIDADKIFHGMGDAAVNDINGKGLGHIVIKDPIWGPLEPLEPKRPWLHPEEPIFKPDRPIFDKHDPDWWKNLQMDSTKANHLYD